MLTLRKSRSEFLIYAPTYSEVSGGVVALHALCARLNELGYGAAIWPWNMPSPYKASGLIGLLRFVARREWRFFDNGPFGNLLARVSDLSSAVMVYPEVVAGNPLRAKHVVRWLLHRPGHHNGLAVFGEQDLFFFYNSAFNDPEINPHPERMLRLTYMHPAYKQSNFGPREGSCVLVRKGAGRVLDQHPADALLVDDMTHEEMAATFNRCEFLYSYDLYSFYTVYAALCGCTPIIIPQPGLSREEWVADRPAALGHAYGADEVARARSETHMLVEALQRTKEEEDEMVRRFVAVCRSEWGLS